MSQFSQEGISPSLPLVASAQQPQNYSMRVKRLYRTSNHNRYAIAISIQSGLGYVLEYKPVLTGGTWTPLSTDLASGSVLNLASPLTPGPSGFFRSQVQ